MKNGLITSPDGTKRWFKDNQLHRADGPATIRPNGDEYFFLNGDLHREDGPAITMSGFCSAWFINGKRHRLDGPAVEFLSSGFKQWFLNGRSIVCDSQEQFERLIKLKAFL